MVVGTAAADVTADWAAETSAGVAPPEALLELVPAAPAVAAEPDVAVEAGLELELQAARVRAAAARAAPPTILDLTLSPSISRITRFRALFAFVACSLACSRGQPTCQSASNCAA
jgi:hypothetical protein